MENAIIQYTCILVMTADESLQLGITKIFINDL
jgi:hypothetical protein